MQKEEEKLKRKGPFSFYPSSSSSFFFFFFFFFFSLSLNWPTGYIDRKRKEGRGGEEWEKGEHDNLTADS